MRVSFGRTLLDFNTMLARCWFPEAKVSSRHLWNPDTFRNVISSVIYSTGYELPKNDLLMKPFYFHLRFAKATLCSPSLLEK